jgi:hypothetical protein
VLQNVIVAIRMNNVIGLYFLSYKGVRGTPCPLSNLL